MIDESDNSAKQLVLYSFISMMLILVFVISPLNKITILSLIMKIIILILLAYTGYLCNAQITLHRPKRKMRQILYKNIKKHLFFLSSGINAPLRALDIFDDYNLLWL
jgi:hypothetical protein